MSQITTIIFDMYDTLVENGDSFWHATFQEIVRDQGLDASAHRLWKEWRRLELEFRDDRTNPGVPFQSYCEAWQGCFAQAFATLGLKGDPAAAAHQAVLDLARRPPYPETLEALDLIQQQWRIAILSNADDDFLLPNVESLGFQFDVVLSSQKARCYKPHADVFREILSLLGVSPQESVYVGDRQFEDVQGPGVVGIGNVWLNRSGGPLDPSLPAPDYQISNLLQLPRLVGRES